MYAVKHEGCAALKGYDQYSLKVNIYKHREEQSRPSRFIRYSNLILLIRNLTISTRAKLVQKTKSFEKHFNSNHTWYTWTIDQRAKALLLIVWDCLTCPLSCVLQPGPLSYSTEVHIQLEWWCNYLLGLYYFFFLLEQFLVLVISHSLHAVCSSHC